MRSRSYFTTGIGSALLVLTACPSDAALPDSDQVKHERSYTPEPLPSEPEIVEPCPDGQMLFEGACTAKTEVGVVLEQRDDAIILDLQEPASAVEEVDAQHQLIEQQIVQVDKTADDLDEIIHDLQREKFERALAKKERLERRPPGDL